MKNPNAMYALSYGLFVLTAQEGAKDNGCIINTAAQVTTTPNRLTIAVNKSNFTHDMILRDGRFTLSVLSQRAPFSVFQHFGFSSGRDTDKFAGYQNAVRGENGLFYVTEGTNAYLSCRTESTLDLGTHTLFLADVLDGDVLSTDPSATYTYYQNHIKPKPQAKPAESGERWVCKVCGYVHEGPLPADFICPLCKHPASDFERM
jgi:flavin reductase (DIM6/NTAB) family NADH-FMN oxidoreductase RutF